MKPTWSVFCLSALLACSATAFQDYPQAVGDLVYRDSHGQIYGRDGRSIGMATSHPGHVGIYLGNGQIAHALATSWWFVPDVSGEVMVTPLAASAGVHSFYEDWGKEDGVEDHGHMGAKTHRDLRIKPNAATLRQNIARLALNQVGEGYDNNFSDQKGPDGDEWTCVGFAEKVYESCGGQEIIPEPENYGDQSAYADGLNITPDGYEHHFNDTICYYQHNVEFSQVPTTLLFGRRFGLNNYIFFPYTQFEQTNLVDSFAQGPSHPGEVVIWASAGNGGTVSPPGGWYPTGTTLTFTAKPDADYAVDQWYLDGSPQMAGVTFQLGNLQQNHSVSVTFRFIGQTPGNDLSRDAALEWRDYQPDGNGDGIPEAGETVGMRIRLANLSGERVRNINAILSSTLPSVTIRQNQLSYGDLEPGGDAWDQSSNLTFDFSTETDVPFHLRATYRKGEANYYQEWDFTVHVWAQGSHPAQFLIHRVVVLRSARGTANSGAVGTLGSGEEADFVLYLKNTGTAHATHVSATLQNVLPAGVDLPVGPRDYEDLLAGGTEQPPQNGQDWYIRRIPRNYLGPITANLVVTYGLGELRQTNRVTLFDVKPAKWIYVSPPSINFGVSPSSQQITRDVTVENTGSDLLTVSSITVSSAFSDVTWSGPGLPWLVPVGGSRTIQVSINPAHLQNQISRTLIFNSDGMAYDPRDCSVTLVGWVYDGTRVYELPTTSFARDLYGADVSGDIIVWSDTRNATSDIYGYDIAKGVEFPICTNAAAQSQPRISGDLVVWNDWRNSPSGPGQAGNCDIYGYDLNKKREIVISSDPANEQLIGVDHGKVAFRREYYHISEASKDGELGVYNLWLLDYASGSLDNVTGFRPNSSHAPMTKVSKCDFGNGILVWSEHTLTWDAGAAGGPRWIITNPWTKVICNDGVVTEALARPPMGYPSADQCRFAYIQGYGPSGEEHVFVWPDHVVDPITTKPVMSEECLALSGNLVFYNKTGIDGVFVYDLSSRQESLFTTQKGVAGLRLDGRTAVWNSWDNQARQLRVYLSFVQQADIAVAPENILVSKIAPIEGEAVTVSATVQNLTQYPSSGDITVRLYLGNPDSGSAELAPPCVIAGGLPAQGQSKIEFPAVVLSKHGTNQIYVRIYPSTPDFGGNNTASKEVVVVSAPGTDGPAVVGFTVTELDGDGDGKVGSDEHVNISWSLADASGIGAVSLLVDGAPFPVTSNGCFSANLGPMSAGAHTAVIVATDADDSPESSTNEFTFAVLRAENVIVRYAGEVVTNKSAISLGTLTLSGNAAAILTILNQGEQPLVIINITVTPGLGLIQPAMSRLEPGNSTVFPVFPDTSRAGAFTGQVAFATSDLRNSPLIFTISWTVAQALPSLQYGRQGGSVILMWSTNAVGYALEATAALLPSQWKPVADAPGVKGDQNVLTISPTSPSNFYRLRKQ